ncbi:MerR family transcriptional regulator [Streptomyces palmae]|uniref:MerR family transcriptional regulator n=1 Tax=Streptomyces palmae TaxID=1701085 RepID=A0A4Z0GB33_9ACTN|nr:MerR family transcriptional regulator [Streptomyces palmae]TGA92142.1 MerR family transcriptional regulator [Streptomyces palmae]
MSETSETYDTPQSSAGLSIGQVAERTGLSVHALRFYENEGLFVGPVRRGPGGHRVYTETDVAWLQVCNRFRASGMPLTVIRQYVDLVRQGPGNEADRYALLRRHEEQLAARIEELTACLAVIREKVGVYEEHLAQGTADRLWAGDPRATGDPAPAGRSPHSG